MDAVYEFPMETKFIDIFEHTIIERKTGYITIVKPKLRVKPRMFFYNEDMELTYVAILGKGGRNIFKNVYSVYDRSEKCICQIYATPIVDKQSIYNEVIIKFHDNKFRYCLGFAKKKFTIVDEAEKVLVAEGRASSSLLKNIVELRSYDVQVFTTHFPKDLWVPVLKGLILMTN